MKLIVNAFLALLLTFSTFAAAKAEGTGTPLIVVRYNQKDVAYQSSLSFAVAEAKKVKPDVAFEVVDVSPEGTIGRLHGQEVVDSIIHMGVDQKLVTLRSENGAGANEEVRVFVR